MHLSSYFFSFISSFSEVSNLKWQLIVAEANLGRWMDTKIKSIQGLEFEVRVDQCTSAESVLLQVIFRKSSLKYKYAGILTLITTDL